MTVDIEVLILGGDWQEDIPRVQSLVKKSCMLVLDESDIPEFTGQIELCVVLTDDDYIKELNHTYRGKNKATNVLSFPANADVYSAMKQSIKHGFPLQLGDIVLGYETVAQEAKKQNKPIKEHLAHLVVHGCLHILGFDHEKDSDAKIMEGLEVELLAKAGYDNPYRDSVV